MIILLIPLMISLFELKYPPKKICLKILINKKTYKMKKISFFYIRNYKHKVNVSSSSQTKVMKLLEIPPLCSLI